ncbi:T9SS type A sorting domain-containing protein [Pontibacter akesuensis]|uniref:Por secretion system C-terminal sorting domain-containing protein n=1 Tax=Pontibacter akesuensis TaxID=388950 RepID=A0A1I7I7Z7_9BACT|nr:T9SS type A sorting domain-containing protein [Pontibacter akesuensis]GHA65657.1 hypothetical protein GCM10007389_18210 [Pontibacter akesuensis]SFU68974.1 Por secretion system C-terminal sorting domain-containing protein [Pontibacter akesuensis]
MAKVYPLVLTGWRTTFMLLALVFFLPLHFAFASDTQHMVPLTLKERVQQADFIVEGEVVRQQSFWDARHENIYTSNLIQVYKSFKGDVRAEQLEIITEGGTVGFSKHVYSTALQLQPGQQGLFFLDRQQQLQRTPATTSLSTTAYGSQQGFVKYDAANRTARSVFDSYSSTKQLYEAVTRETGQSYRSISRNPSLEAPALENRQQAQKAPLAPVITSFSPTVASAGTGTVLTINGTGFGNSRGDGFVAFQNADDGGQTTVKPLETEYISWTNTQIKLYIPSATEEGGTAGSGRIIVSTNDDASITSLAPIILEFAYSNVEFEGKAFKPILINQNRSGGYTIRFAPSMQNRQAAKEGFRRAMNSWICVSEVNWEIGSPTTVEKAADDGVNVIRFAPGSTTGAGVLARTISRYEGCASNNDTLFWVSEFDMEINSTISWQYGPAGPGQNQFDFETVMLHELGHAHQLSHVNLDRAVMLYAIESERLYRDLSTLDIKGANLVMANSTGANICEQPPIVPLLTGDCNLSPEIYTIQADFFMSNSAVRVDWVTINERTVDYFVVQRSADRIAWEDVSTVDAKGSRTNTDSLDYTLTDTSPLPDVSYYRLQVFYTDGTSSFSPSARVLDPASLRVFKVFPNPFVDELSLFYIVQTSTTMDIEMYSMTGKLVRDFTLQVYDANVPVTLDLSGIAAGVYILKWQEGNRSGQQKVIKL